MNEQGHNREKLVNHILLLSNADSFKDALQEWKLVDVSIKEDECPCGQIIKERCHIKNLKNGNITFVGNVCINRFMEIETGRLFDGFKRIKNDDTANANKDLIEYAYKAGHIFDIEYKFLLETKNKRKLSPKQVAWKQKINQRIIKGNQVKVNR